MADAEPTAKRKATNEESACDEEDTTHSNGKRKTKQRKCRQSSEGENDDRFFTVPWDAFELR